jgi:hypothetical protein
VAQLSGKYFKSQSFLSLSSHSSPSWLWKGILKTKPIISQGACHRIHYFSSLLVWNSPWIPTVPFFLPTPFPSMITYYPNLMISELFSPNGSWNLPLLHYLFSHPCIKEILKIPISHSLSSNFLWTPSTNGLFSSSSAYRLISNHKTSSSIYPLKPKFWKSLLKLKLNARLILFLLKIAWDILPTKTRPNPILHLSQSNSLCPLCKSEANSLSHIFFSCIFAQVAWRSSFRPLNSLAWSSLSLSDWIKGIINPHLSFGISKSDSHLFQIFASVLCDLLWFSRNKVAHDGVISDISSLANSIRRISLNHAAVWNSTSPSPKESWIPPPAGTFKVNFDTVIKDFCSSSSVQKLQRQHHKGHLPNQPPCDLNYGEALATSMNLKNFIIKGDSLVVITALPNPPFTQDWHIDSIIANTLTLLPAPSLWKAKKVNRSANFCAHHVAFWATARVHSGCIPTYFPPSPSSPICSGKDPPPLLGSRTLVPSFSIAMLLQKKKKKKWD